MGDGAGCAWVLAVFLSIATIVLFAVGQWTAACFVMLAAALLWAGLLDPG